MSPPDCMREADVIDAITSGRWPDRAGTELRAHVTACAVCTDVAAVASALYAEQEATWAEAVSVPSAHVVWLRAQARGRAEAAQQAARPIAIMQALGFACAAAVVSGVIGVAAFWVWTRADLLAAVPIVPVVGLDVMGSAIRGTLLAIGMWLVFAPFAVYLAASDD